MRFRPGSLIAALSYGYSALRRAQSALIPQYVLLHKDSRNYNSVSMTQWDALSASEQQAFEVAAILHRHNGPEITSIEWEHDAEKPMRAMLELAGPNNTWIPYKFYDTVQAAVAAGHKLANGGFKVRMHYGHNGLAHFNYKQTA